MHYIGIDLGGTSIKGAVVTEGGAILKEASCPTQRESGPEHVAREIAGLITALAEGYDPQAIGGVGVGWMNYFAFLIIAVFISGLMVGRTPEFLGHKVEAREMKIATMVVLMHPFLILVGTVVNNGILYVDTVNQYRSTMDLRTALIEAGATRIRPILMTSMTTILSMIPMALAIGSSGSTTQGLAIVDIGGLSVGVIVALFMVPVYYALLSRKPKEEIPDVD